MGVYLRTGLQGSNVRRDVDADGNDKAMKRKIERSELYFNVITQTHFIAASSLWHGVAKGGVRAMLVMIIMMVASSLHQAH